MSGADILSQDEIDALLNGVDSGDVDTGGANLDDGTANSYDFANQERIVRGRLPTLEMINERFARLFRVSLFNMMRRSPDISVNGVQMVKFSEYVHTLFVPSSLSMVHVHPLKGTSLFMLHPELVFTTVDNFFGGYGRFRNKIEGREFTPTELRVIEKMVGLCMNDMKEAWAPVLDIDFESLGHEVNPHLANIVSPSEVLVVSSFHVELDGGGGDLQLVIPYSSIEPIRDLLDAGVQSDRSEQDDRWTNSLREEMQAAEVQLSSTLAQSTLSLRQIMKLKAGDIIPIDMPEKVVLKAEEIPVFRGHLGVSNGSVAIKVSEPIILPKREEDRFEFRARRGGKKAHEEA